MKVIDKKMPVMVTGGTGVGFTRKYVSRNVGYPIKFDNSYSKEDLGMTYIPVEQTVTEHFQQILDDGFLDKKESGK